MKYLINDTICEKVEVGGFDYYYLPKELNIFFLGDETEIQNIENNDYVYHVSLGKNYKVIATNNSSLDLPQVIDEAEVAYLSVFNSKGSGYNMFENGYNKAKETYQFTVQDLINFNEWYLQNEMLSESYNDLIQYWQEQRIINLNVK